MQFIKCYVEKVITHPGDLSVFDIERIALKLDIDDDAPSERTIGDDDIRQAY